MQIPLFFSLYLYHNCGYVILTPSDKFTLSAIGSPHGHAVPIQFESALLNRIPILVQLQYRVTYNHFSYSYISSLHQNVSPALAGTYTTYW